MKNEKIMPMNSDQFSNYLLFMQYYSTDTIEFALDNDEFLRCMPDVDNCSEWYFARIIKMREYTSSSVLLDYCGGECSHAITLPNDNDYIMHNFETACHIRDLINDDDIDTFKNGMQSYFKDNDVGVIFVSYRTNIISEDQIVKVINV